MVDIERDGAKMRNASRISIERDSLLAMMNHPLLEAHQTRKTEHLLYYTRQNYMN